MSCYELPNKDTTRVVTLNEGKDESAFGRRDAPFALNILAMWQGPQEKEEHVGWAKDFFAAMLPYATGGVYELSRRRAGGSGPGGLREGSV